MNVLLGLTENDSTTGPTPPGETPPFPANALVGTNRASSSGSARRVRTLLASARTPDGLQPATDHAACMRVISSRAPFLFNGSLRLPHLGDCTHDGQPDRHGHSSMRRRASATRVSNSVNPIRVIPTPPGWPS